MDEKISLDEDKKEKIEVNEDGSAESEERTDEHLKEIFSKIETLIAQQNEEKELIKKLTEEVYKAYSIKPKESKEEKFKLEEFIERI